MLIPGSGVRLRFYHKQEDWDKSRDVWLDVLEHGDGMIAHWAASALFLEGEGEKVVKEGNGWTSPEARIARAYILAISDQTTDRTEAREIFEELSPTADTWLSRHFLIQIPLLLQEPTVARSQCETWLRTKTKPELQLPLGGWEKESIQFIANPSKRLFNPSSENLKERFYANYQLALLEFSNGQLPEALQYLEACGSYDVPQLRWWVDGFKKEIAARIAGD